MNETIITIPADTRETKTIISSDLLKEKTEFEQKNTPVEYVTEWPLSLIWSALIAERELYIAQSHNNFIPSQTPTLAPQWTTGDIVPEIRFESTNLENFLSRRGNPKNVERSSKMDKWTIKKTGQARDTKWNIQAWLMDGTVIRTDSGEILSEESLVITDIEESKRTKAKKQYEQKMKNRWNLRKWQAEAQVQGFEFGLPGRHLIFSQPIALIIDTPHMSDGVVVDIMTAHAGESEFHTRWLSTNPDSGCTTTWDATIPGNQAIVKNGQVVFYTCGASSFTMNPSGGGAGSNDLRIIIGDCAQTQIYYNNLAQVYGGNPAATWCTGAPWTWPALRIGGTTYGNTFTAWTSANTVGTTIGNTYTATSTMSITTGGRTYQLIIDWEHTAPNKYITWNWQVIVPAGNTLPIRFYYGVDSMIAGNDANDVGYFTNTGWRTIWVYDNVANVLSAFRYISGLDWTAHQANGYNTVRTQIANGANFTNDVQTTGGDLWYGINWDFGTPTVATTYTGSIEWRMLPFVSADVVDLIPGIWQPEWPLTTGFTSQMPITVTNVWNLTSSWVHTAVLTIPTNISGPTSAFTDNGWSCGAQAGTTVTCTRTTNIAPLDTQTFYIPVIPQPAAGGTNVTFNLSISNPGDSDTANNTAYATNAVVSAAPVISPGWVTGPRFWSKADGWKNCSATGCTITTWFNSWVVAVNATTGLGIVTYDPATQINFNPTLYFNNASLNINNNLTLPTRANSIFVVSRIGAGGNFYIGTQTNTNNTRSWRTSPTTDQWMRHNSTVFYNGTNNRAVNVPAITSTVRQNGGASAGFTNGRQLLSSASTLTFTVNNLGIWRVANTNSTLSNVAEVIIYNTALTAANQNRVESYLALKYGITLDQTTATNYTLVNNGTAWNASLATTYNRDIAGIARDDLASLNQLRSQSINNPWDILVARDGASIASNSRALVWGNNWAGTGTFSTTDAPSPYRRIARVWQFQEKLWDVWVVKISYPTNSLPSGASGPIYMLVDNDGVFAAWASIFTGTLVWSNWEWTLNIADMQYVTFAEWWDITPPTIASNSIASGTLMPHGNFSLTYTYTDTESGINASTATWRIYSWNSGTNSYNTTALGGYSVLAIANSSSATINIANLPHGRYRIDLSISDNAGNITTQSYTYFVDAIEWTISTDVYNIWDIVWNTTVFWTGELMVTIRTVWAWFSLTTSPLSALTRPGGDTINYWNGTFWVWYDLWSGSGFGGAILSYSPNATLATVAKNINPNWEKNTFVYRVRYGAYVDFMQSAGDYIGTASFRIILDY